MSTDNRHTTHYSASDIAKYRKGEMSAREMHDLEQAALDDPFLADAIEGFMQHPDPQPDLTDLRERLSTRVTHTTRRQTVILLRRRLTVAAAVILLLGMGYTFLNRHHVNERFNSPAPSALAAAAPARAPQPPTDSNQASQPATSIAAASHPAAKAAASHPTAASHPAAAPPDYSHSEAVTKSEKAEKPAADAPAQTSAQTYLPATTIASDSILFRHYKSFNSDADVLKKLPNLPLTDSTTLTNEYAKENATYFSRSNATYYRNLNQAAAQPLVYTGKVLDFQNHPLAGAFLALNGNYQTGTTTDDKGQFLISLRPRDSTRQLTVSMIGYDHASLAVNALSVDDQQNNIIRLKPSSNNLDEVVVVGYGNHRKATEFAAPSDDRDEKLDTLWTHAAPVIGRQAYLQYLNIAKKKLGLDSTITGTETLSFEVSRNGALSSFKIEQSISPAHDAGIIRLVTDGPAWRLTRGKTARASVTVNF